MAKIFLSVIIPAYNEAKRLPITLIDIDRHLAGQNFTYEIVVGLSPCEDDTDSILARFSHVIKKLKVVPLKENFGKGHAVRSAMKEAKGAWRLVMDADNSVSVVEFLKMIPYMKGRSVQGEGYEVIVGSRKVSGAYQNPPPPRLKSLFFDICSLKLRLSATRGVRDPWCGFKCYSQEAAEKIFSKSSMNGWACEVEALFLASAFGYKIKEVPVFYSYDEKTHMTGSSYAQVFFDTLKLFLRGVFGRT